MPFKLIKGTFHPDSGIPDGDSVRFMADDDTLFDSLKGPATEFKPDGTVQLRYEGIDAIEKAAIEPFAGDSRDKNLELINELSDPYEKTPRGFILAYLNDKHRRPVAFVYSGNIDERDGSDIRLEGDLIKRSINYKMVLSGHAYTMFYETLFSEIREVLDEAYKDAKKRKVGIHQSDASTKGFEFLNRNSLKTIPPIFPKLWRRLEEYSRNNNNISKFKNFLQSKVRDKLHTISDRRTYITFDNAIQIDGNRIKLLYEPNDMIFTPYNQSVVISSSNEQNYRFALR